MPSHSKPCFQVVSRISELVLWGANSAFSLESISLSFGQNQNHTVMETLDPLFRRDDKQLAAYRAACTLKTCPIKESYYAYRPSLPTNAVFLALFSFSLCSFILQAALSRRFIGFTIAMVSGCLLEVLGYIGRIMSWYNPFNQVCPPWPFLTGGILCRY